MAEEFVTPDRHESDLNKLRLEVREDIHNVQQSLAVLTKTVENLQYQVQQGFSDIKVTMQNLEQRSQQGFNLLQGEIQRLEQRSQQDINNLRQDMREARSTTTRQMWTMITLVIAIVAGGVIKLIFFP